MKVTDITTPKVPNDIHWKDVNSSMVIEKTVGGYSADAIPVFIEERNKHYASWRLDRLSEVNSKKVA